MHDNYLFYIPFFIMDLYNSGRLEQLSNTVWASSSHTSSMIENVVASSMIENVTDIAVTNAHVLTSNASLLGCAFPYF